MSYSETKIVPYRYTTGTANNIFLVPNWKKRTTLGLGGQCTLPVLTALSGIGTYLKENNGQDWHGFACFDDSILMCRCGKTAIFIPPLSTT